MLGVIQFHNVKYTIYEIYEQKIRVEDKVISVPANEGSVIFVKSPKGRNKGDLIKVLEQLENQLPPTRGSVFPGPGEILYPEYTVYKIYEREIEVEDEILRVALPIGKENPFFVMSPEGIDKDQLNGALKRLKAELSQVMD